MRHAAMQADFTHYGSSMSLTHAAGLELLQAKHATCMFHIDLNHDAPRHQDGTGMLSN